MAFYKNPTVRKVAKKILNSAVAVSPAGVAKRAIQKIAPQKGYNLEGKIAKQAQKSVVKGALEGKAKSDIVKELQKLKPKKKGKKILL